MMKTLGLTTAALMAALTAPAQAQVATVTVTGNVLNGLDATGRFGAAGANLAGLPFSAIFTIAAKGGTTAVDTSALSFLYGAGAASPVSAALTIGTGTYNFGGSWSGTARATNGVTPSGVNGTDSLYYAAEDTDVSTMPPPPASSLLYVSIDSLRDLLDSADYNSYSTISLNGSDNAQGLAQIAHYDPATGSYGPMTYANLSLSTISAKATAAVPEPATWMMMILGFGMAGAALRRQRVRSRVRFA